MLKLSILNNQNEVIRVGKFETIETLDEYVSKINQKGIVGLKPQRPELVLNEETGEMEPTGVIIPAEFTIEIEDTTAQIEQEQINATALAFLDATDFKVLRHLRDKALGRPSKLSEEEYLALEQQRADAAERIIR